MRVWARRSASVTRALGQEQGERLERGGDGRPLGVAQAAQPLGQPGGAAGAGRAQHAHALAGDAEADAAAVLGGAHPGDEARALQPVDVAGHGRCRHALMVGERPHSDVRVRADDVQKGRLAGGDPEPGQLPAQMPVELQEQRPQPVCEFQGIRNS